MGQEKSENKWNKCLCFKMFLKIVDTQISNIFPQRYNEVKKRFKK